MKKSIYLYPISYCYSYAKFLKARFNIVFTNKPQDAQVILFPGGADINPAYYNAKTHPETYCNYDTDSEQFDIFYKCLSKDILKIGICRGHQLLCVGHGGKLIQNVNNHCTPHNIQTNTGDTYEITSCHHQMIYPYNIVDNIYDILAWASPKRSTIYEGDTIDQNFINDNSEFKEIEVIHYSLTNSLGIQGHPEMMPIDCITNDYLCNLVDLYLP